MFKYGDIVVYQFEGNPKVAISQVILGPYREGAWQEYQLINGDRVREHEILGYASGRLQDRS